jgi:uncharacterized protein (TIGR03086 family)
MSDVHNLFKRAVDQFGAFVDQVKDDQWSSSTPCTDWDVRALVNHLVNETLWMPPLLDGKTIEEVGDRFDGDMLGEDPKQTWKQASEEAISAAGEGGALERTVHLSFGDFPGEGYIAQVLTDHVIHAWDLARGIGANDELDPDTVQFAYDYLAPQADAWRSAGAFGDKVEVDDSADTQTKLLAIAGRKR